MNTALSTKRDPQRVAAAWDWMMRLRDKSVSEDALAAWLHWYESDAANKDAYDEAQRLWQQAPRLVSGPEALPDHAWRRPASGVTRRRRWLWMSAAAGLCALAVGLTLQRGHSVSGPVLVAATAQGTAATTLVQEAALPDGSQVQLAAHSSLSMSFTDQERRLTMSDGVVFFKVAHNKERPFIVEVGKVSVRAVGTAFNIRNAGGRVVVTVTEGSVDVSGDSAQHSHIAAGTELTWEREQASPTLAIVNPARALSWREGRLDYENEPLAAAIDDINRYSSRHVIIRDAAVGRIRFSGSVRTDTVEEWVRAIPELFPVDVLTDATGNIVLMSRSG